MEKKQGFFSALKEEVTRGISPSRSRRSKSGEVPARSGEALAPLMEGPDQCTCESREGERKEGWGKWVKGQLTRGPAGSPAGTAHSRSDLRLLLAVLGAPLAPVHVAVCEPLPHLSVKDTPIETSSAQYILQQFLAASGGQSLLRSLKTLYINGSTTMSVTQSHRNPSRNSYSPGRNSSYSGRFVIWAMRPDMWYAELAVGGSKVRAGSDGRIVWRHTAWLGSHGAKGPVRPLRRVIQGLDPLTTASMFADSRCIGERKMNGEDCFVLKLSTDPQTLKSRSTESSAEIIRHVAFGYFSQKTGLLTHLEDSHLTRIQPGSGGETVYWETLINSEIGEYKCIDGVLVAHKGKSVVSLLRFGDVALSQQSVTRMEESWEIDEVAFDVKGVELDCFIPPKDLKAGIFEGQNGNLDSRIFEGGQNRDLKAGIFENRDLESGFGKSGLNRAKVSDDWKVEI